LFGDGFLELWRRAVADPGHAAFPLRRALEDRAIPVGRGSLTCDADKATLVGAEDRRGRAERLTILSDALYAGETCLGRMAVDVDLEQALADRRLNQVVNRLGWAVVGIIRAGAGRPAQSPATADSDKLVPIAVAAQILGVSKNAAEKRARKKGFDELVGGRVHIRRSLIGRLYEKAGRVG
jgi:hypothetical protein